MDTNIVNIWSVSVWCLLVLSNTEAKFEVQFIKKLSNTEAELRKSVYKLVFSFSGSLLLMFISLGHFHFIYDDFLVQAFCSSFVRYLNDIIRVFGLVIRPKRSSR